MDKLIHSTPSRIFRPESMYQPTEARSVFCLSQTDFVTLDKILPNLVEAMSSPNPNRLPPVGKTWKQMNEIWLRREGAPALPVTIKKPFPHFDPQELFANITYKEHKLLEKGLDCFAPTYPLGNLVETGLFVQYFGLEVDPPEGMTYFDLKSTFEEYLRSLNLGVNDFPNNAIYTEHGWLLFDVDDVV